MPVYAFRCRKCGLVTDEFAPLYDAPERVRCEHCNSEETHRIISRVACHASEASRTARLDPRNEEMVNHAMKISENADVDRLLRRMKPFPTKNKK